MKTIKKEATLTTVELALLLGGTTNSDGDESLKKGDFGRVSGDPIPHD